MSGIAKPVRSYLFVPANRAERFDKAVASGADALILDLEDSVPLADKDSARHAVQTWMNARQSAAPECPEIWVRVNALTSEFHAQDMALLAHIQPTGIVLPKCEGRDDLLAVDAELASLEHSTGRANAIQVIVIATETARAMQRIHTLDAPHPRLRGVLWGAEDLAASLGVRALRDVQGHYLSPALRARDAALLASHACGATAIDGVYIRLDDSEGLAAETRAHAALGFTAKAAIHPAQIAVIHAALAPSADDLAWAQEVVTALQDGAISSGRVRGAMVDQPHLTAARRILASR